MTTPVPPVASPASLWTAMIAARETYFAAAATHREAYRRAWVAARETNFAAAGAETVLDGERQELLAAWRAARAAFRACSFHAGAVKVSPDDGESPESSDVEATAWIATWWSPPSPAAPAVEMMVDAGLPATTVAELAAAIESHAAAMVADGVSVAGARVAARFHGMNGARCAVEAYERARWRRWTAAAIPRVEILGIAPSEIVAGDLEVRVIMRTPSGHAEGVIDIRPTWLGDAVPAIAPHLDPTHWAHANEWLAPALVDLLALTFAMNFPDYADHAGVQWALSFVWNAVRGPARKFVQGTKAAAS